MHSLPLINIIVWNGVYVTKSKPTLTHHNHQSPLFTLGFTLGGMHEYHGFGQMYNAYTHHHNIIQYFTALQVLCTLPINSPTFAPPCL